MPEPQMYCFKCDCFYVFADESDPNCDVCRAWFYPDDTKEKPAPMERPYIFDDLIVLKRSLEIQARREREAGHPFKALGLEKAIALISPIARLPLGYSDPKGFLERLRECQVKLSELRAKALDRRYDFQAIGLRKAIDALIELSAKYRHLTRA